MSWQAPSPPFGSSTGSMKMPMAVLSEVLYDGSVRISVGVHSNAAPYASRGVITYYPAVCRYIPR